MISSRKKKEYRNDKVASNERNYLQLYGQLSVETLSPGIYTVTRVHRAPQTKGEEECAAAAKNTARTHTPDAHRYMLADIQQVTDTDVAQTTSYILYPLASLGGCNRARSGGRGGQSFRSKVKNARKKIVRRVFRSPCLRSQQQAALEAIIETVKQVR